MLIVLKEDVSAAEQQTLKEKLLWMGLQVRERREGKQASLAVVQGLDKHTKKELFTLARRSKDPSLQKKYKLASREYQRNLLSLPSKDGALEGASSPFRRPLRGRIFRADWRRWRVKLLPRCYRFARRRF